MASKTPNLDKLVQHIVEIERKDGVPAEYLIAVLTACAELGMLTQKRQDPKILDAVMRAVPKPPRCKVESA